MQNNRTRIIAMIGLAAMLLPLAGCQTNETKDERSAGRVVDDKHITENVRKALDSEPVYKFTDVNINTFAGVVQLSGFATIQSQKERAGQLAQTVDGVTQVNNNISLKPQLQPTGRTEAPIYNSDAPRGPAQPQPGPKDPSYQNSQSDQNPQSDQNQQPNQNPQSK